jgi:integrase
MAMAEGLAATTIDRTRGALLRYSRFLESRYRTDIFRAGWQELAAYRRDMLSSGLARLTVKGYIVSVMRYYLLRVRQRGDSAALELYHRMRAVEGNLARGAKSQPFEPLSSTTLRKIVRASTSYSRIWRNNHWIDSEDHAFIMTLLYTGGRAQFYGLRVEELDFKRAEIRTRGKGGAPLVIPLHPKLARVLRKHLAGRKYASAFLFREGKDATTVRGQDANKGSALRICKRVQKAAGLAESLHPHRFRKTLATMGRSLGMDIQQVQAILGHRDIQQTMNVYVRPDMDQVKRDFASLDLAKGRRKDRGASQIQVIAALKRLAPVGREAAWAMIVDGFVEVLTGNHLREDEYARQSLNPYKFSSRVRRTPA